MNFIFQTITRLVVIASTSVLLSLSNVAHAKQDPNLVVLFGDSISLGFNQASIFSQDNRSGDGALQFGVPSQYLDEILRDNNRKSLVANFGYGGSPSGPTFNESIGVGNGLQRITSDLSTAKELHGPSQRQYILILYGTNDMDYDIPASTTGMNIELMIDRSIAQGFIPIVGTIPPTDSAPLVNPQIRNAVARSQNKGNEVYLVDHYIHLLPNWATLRDSDGLHPNNNGYLAIANYWFNNRLESLIPRDRLGNINGTLYLLLDDE